MPTKTRKTPPTNADLYEKMGFLIKGMQSVEANNAEMKAEIVSLKSEVHSIKITWNKFGGAIFLLGAVFSFLGYSAKLIIDYVKP